jgi:hypothetical protein
MTANGFCDKILIISKRISLSLKGKMLSMEITQQFENEIAPFLWVEYDDNSGAGVCLNVVGRYLQDVFDTRSEEGFIGNGYDWGSLAQVFLEEKCSGLQSKIIIDSEAQMFCADSDNREALYHFILQFKKACEDKNLILDLFSRAEYD